MRTTITPKQTPTFRALIATDAGQRLTVNDVATQAELIAEGITDEYPISYSLLMLYEGVYTEVEGFTKVQLSTDCIVDEIGYNFSYTPEGRVTPMFPKSGRYAVEFKIYPRSGPIVVWRSDVLVEDVE